jgi:predicted ribonuclease YlaK
MKKNYVLDTNVLLHDPFAIHKFEDNDLILPIYVIEEIDQFKRESNERGRNARTVTRLLDDKRNGGSLSRGVPMGDGGSLRVHVPERRPELAIALDPKSTDHAILETALDVRDSAPDRPTVFVTMDVNLRIRADALGLKTEAYENQSVDAERLDLDLAGREEILEPPASSTPAAPCDHQVFEIVVHGLHPGVKFLLEVARQKADVSPERHDRTTD